MFILLVLFHTDCCMNSGDSFSSNSLNFNWIRIITDLSGMSHHFNISIGFKLRPYILMMSRFFVLTAWPLLGPSQLFL